ncbi:MAG: rhodanese-like domain-containing protein [Acidimicrobiales bacterium]
MTYGTGSPPGVPEVNVEELEAAVAAGAPVVDVREHDEYASGHVAGALLMPMAEVVARVHELRKPGTFYIVCATGARSGRAAQWYRAQGIDARNLGGGMKAWIADGKPVVYGPQSS